MTIEDCTKRAASPAMSFASGRSIRSTRSASASVRSAKNMKLQSQAQQRRKPAPPLVALTDLELPDARYPPFDPEDPFASLIELRHRSRSYSYNGTLDSALHQSPSASTQPNAPDYFSHAPSASAVEAPSDHPYHSNEKAFPSGLGQRYTLTVDLPGPLYPFDIAPGRGRAMNDRQMTESPKDIESVRQDALAKLTGGSGTGSASGSSKSGKQQAARKSLKPCTTSSSTNAPVEGGKAKAANRSRSVSMGPSPAPSSGDRDHHRRYTQIATLFREHSAPQLRTEKGEKPGRKSHYIPRKASTLNYMYTPPLTPDLSGDSSFTSTSSLVIESDPPPPLPPLPLPANMTTQKPKSPLDAAPDFVRKLLKRRSTSTSLKAKKNMETSGKDLPPLPIHITKETTTEEKTDSPAGPTPAPPTPAPTEQEREPLSLEPPVIQISVKKSEETLVASVASRSKVAASSPSPMKKPSRQSMRERMTAASSELDLDLVESASEPDIDPTFQPNKAAASGVSLPLKGSKLFGFRSRSLLRSRVDLYDVKGKAPVPADTHAPAPFDEDAPPMPRQLEIAADLPVINENGVRVRFGDLWDDRKTLVVFIRHFRASACQDYVRSISSEVDVEALGKAGLKFVIIGMGSHSLIAPYRKLTGTTLPIYTDPTLTLHHVLGMTLRTTNAGPAAERGHYVSSAPSFTRALREAVSRNRKLPLFERAGDASQLGGEFLLGPGLVGADGGGCHFAHRMRHTKGHAPVLDVVERSGVVTARVRRFRRRGGLGRGGMEMGSGEGGAGRRESMDDEEAWMARRRRSLVRMKKKRAARRIGIMGGKADAPPCVPLPPALRELSTPPRPTLVLGEEAVLKEVKEKKSVETFMTKRFSSVEEELEEADISFEVKLTQ